MEHQRLKSVRRILARVLPVMALVVSSTALTARAERPTKRAPAEVALGGLTSAEHAANKLILRTELEGQTPAGALQRPIRVELTQKDRENIAAPTDGPAPLRIGVVKAIAPRVNVVKGNGMERGMMQEVDAGRLVWALTIASPGAQAIRVNLSGFSLPGGAEMYVYSPEGAADGPYTGTGRNGTGQFWTRSVNGETAVIQVHFDGTNRIDVSFVIAEIAHISGRLRDAGLQPVLKSHDTWPCADNASCLVDANCPAGSNTPADPAKDGIAKMEWIAGQYVNTCTGGLLTDTDSGSQIPYFLTANHCTSSSISNLETWFNYTTDSCNGVCPHNILTGGAPPSDTVGYTVLESGSSSDYTLGTLNQPPPAGAVFMAWSNAPVANANGTPLYRISNANFGPQVYSQQDVDTSTGTCTGIPRGAWIYSANNVGSTMGGSSGSPVLNGNSEVVGQLTGCCGFNCGNDCDLANNWTIDGALAAYWDQVSYLLDPVPGCTGDPECDDGLFCTGAETCVGGSCQSSGDPCGGGTVCNEATDSCDAPACDDDGSCEAGEDCNNCPNDCRSKTGGKPSGRYCCDGDLPDCGDTRCSESGWSCGGGGGCTSDPECDDGAWCNGAETCVGGSCQSGTDPCPGQGCDETNDVCITCAGNKDPCNNNGDCCSGNCRNGRCKGN